MNNNNTLCNIMDICVSNHIIIAFLKEEHVRKTRISVHWIRVLKVRTVQTILQNLPWKSASVTTVQTAPMATPSMRQLDRVKVNK